MKRFGRMALLFMVLFVLCGCGHEHTWTDATCTAPKTCSECGKTEGEALGHNWIDATCTEPRTCSVCGKTEREALGHNWIEATCTEPRTCSVCGETEGEALGHTWNGKICTEQVVCAVCGKTGEGPNGHEWQDATCTEPKTCAVCGETEGDALGHEWEEATVFAPKTCSVCGQTEGSAKPIQWNEPIVDGNLTVGFYRNEAHDRHWIEIKLDGSPAEVLVYMLKNGDFSRYGLYNTSFADWVAKAANYTDTAYKKGNITYFEDTEKGWGHWLVWMDMDSENSTVLGLANNKEREITVFCRRTLACETLQSGSRGVAVEELQQKLTDLGYYTAYINGSFDYATKTAVEDFQTDNNLPVTGVVDYVTYSAIFN